MAQIFSPLADRRLRIVLALSACAILALGVAGFVFVRSDRAWGVGVAAPQPIPYSHAIHAGQLGLDCRYCHAGVEHAAGAGMPTAETCLGCHNAVWNVSAQFAPLETALALGDPVVWGSVHRLPEHVRFHHGAHVSAGIGCGTCHGDVAAMPRTVKTQTMSMGWCLDCHRSPEARVPFTAALGQPAAAGQEAAAPAPRGGQPVITHFGVEIPPLTRCSACHR